MKYTYLEIKHMRNFIKYVFGLDNKTAEDHLRTYILAGISAYAFYNLAEQKFLDEEKIWRKKYPKSLDEYGLGILDEDESVLWITREYLLKASKEIEK